MKKTTFYWITTLLYWGSRFWLAVGGAVIIMGLVFLLLKNTSSVSFNNRPTKYLFDPVVTLKVKMHNSWSIDVDSLIKCENTSGSLGGNIYINKYFDEEEEHSLLMKQESAKTRQRLADGTLKIKHIYTNVYSAYSIPRPEDKIAFYPDEMKRKFQWEVSRPKNNTESTIRLRPKLQQDKIFILITNWIIMLLPIIGGFLMLWKLFLLFGNLRNNEVFTDNNFKLIRQIGIAVLLIWLVNYTESIQNYWIDFRLDNFHLNSISKIDGKEYWPLSRVNMSVKNDYSLWPFTWTFITAILIILIAEIFRRGLELQEEQNLTI